MSGETRIIYHIDEEETPYLVKVPVPIDRVTLADFKNVLCRPNYKFFFKSYDDEFGEVKEEIVDDDANLPCINGKVISWLVSSEGSNASDTNSQVADSIPPSDSRRPVGRPLPRGLRALAKPSAPPFHPDDTTTCTETDSVISSRRINWNSQQRGRREGNSRGLDKYSRFDGSTRKYRSHGHAHQQHYDSSLASSDLETTTFLESDDDDDASSRITATTEHSSVSHVFSREQQQRRQRRRKHKQPSMSRSSSFSSITDSTMSLNVITVTLNMSHDENGPSFFGISLVGESNKGGDGGIYVGSIMKGGAVAKDGRIEPGDLILQVNDTSFENKTNDEAVRFLREVVQKPGPIKLVVAKCWDSSPKGYFTIPRTEPVRPIDPEAWVAHVAANGDYLPRPHSASTLTSTHRTHSPPLSSSLPDTERTVEEVVSRLTTSTPPHLIVREMQKPDSGLEIRDRNWLKINIPNAFIGADVVEWLLNHVDGLSERKEARKFASSLLKRSLIRHTVNKATFSEQCYYTFSESLSSYLGGLKIRDDESGECSSVRSDPLCESGWGGNTSGHGFNYGGGVPLYAPVPYGGYESAAYSYPQEHSAHSGSGGSSNDTGGSRRERQHLVREGKKIPLGFSAPLEMRPQDSDSDGSGRSSKKSQGASYANHIIIANHTQFSNSPHNNHPTSQSQHSNDLANSNYSTQQIQQHIHPLPPNDFFLDVM